MRYHIIIKTAIITVETKPNPLIPLGIPKPCSLFLWMNDLIVATIYINVTISETIHKNSINSDNV
jgi:hypothetical protein